MTVISAPQEYNEDELYVDLQPTLGRSLYLKCEGFNFAGSVKLKAAAEMVEAAERDGVLRPGSILIESSSGNLGVALEHDRRQPGLPLRLRHRLPLQPGHQAHHGGAGRRGAHRSSSRIPSPGSSAPG